MSKELTEDRLIFEAFTEQTEDYRLWLMEVAIRMIGRGIVRNVTDAMEVLYRVSRYTQEVK